MGQAEHYEGNPSAPLQPGWTEYSIAMATAPSGNQFAVLRRRTSTSARTFRNSRSTQAVWSASELTDILTTLEENIRMHLIVTGGLQLTLPLDQ